MKTKNIILIGLTSIGLTGVIVIKWNQLNIKRSNLVSEIKKTTVNAEFTLDSLTHLSKEKIELTTSFLQDNSITFTDINKEMDALKSTQIKSAQEFQSWSTALSKINNKVAETLISKMKSKTTKTSQINMIQQQDLKIDSSIKSYHDLLKQREKLITQLKQIPFTSSVNFPPLPSLAIYELAAQKQEMNSVLPTKATH